MEGPVGESDEPVFTPPSLPTLGFTLDWRHAPMSWRAALVSLIGGVCVILALKVSPWFWCGLIVLWLSRGGYDPIKLGRSAMLPGLRVRLAGKSYFLVLTDLQRAADSWCVGVRYLRPVTEKDIAGRDHVLGFVRKDVTRMAFLPVLSVLTPAQQHYGAADRITPGYFQLLERLRLAMEPGVKERVHTISTSDLMRLFPESKSDAVASTATALVAPQAPVQSPGEAAQSEFSGSWCAGMPWVGERALDDADRAQLLRLYKQTRLRGGLWAAHALQGLASLVACTLLLFGQMQGFIYVVPVLGAVIWAIVPESMATAAKRFKLAHRLRHDLIAGAVQAYRGRAVDHSTQEDADFTRLLQLGLVPSNLEETTELLVGTHSRSIVSVNGRHARNPELVHVSHPATIPDSWIVSLPAGSMAHLREGTRGKRRWMSADEKMELSEHIRRLHPLRWWHALLILLVPAYFRFLAIKMQWWVSPVLVVYLLGFIVWSFIRWRAQRFFQRDLDLEWLLVVVNDEGKSLCEILPISGAYWNESGTPSTWRRQQRL
jgi:hypothetical protein